MHAPRYGDWETPFAYLPAYMGAACVSSLAGWALRESGLVADDRDATFMGVGFVLPRSRGLRSGHLGQRVARALGQARCDIACRDAGEELARECASVV